MFDNFKDFVQEKILFSNSTWLIIKRKVRGRLNSLNKCVIKEKYVYHKNEKKKETGLHYYHFQSQIRNKTTGTSVIAQSTRPTANVLV